VRRAFARDFYSFTFKSKIMEQQTMTLPEVTTKEEKCRRFDEINNQFFEKYFDLVWYATTDPDELEKEGNPELLAKLKQMNETYGNPAEGWKHGFNCGILAYSRFLLSYVQDWLSPASEGPAFFDLINVDGKTYEVIDGGFFADEMWPDFNVFDGCMLGRIERRKENK
jgi:hypothetical protein